MNVPSPTKKGSPCKLCKNKGEKCHIHSPKKGTPAKRVSPKKSPKRSPGKSSMYQNLPCDVLLKIASNLDNKDYVSLSAVSAQLHKCLQSGRYAPSEKELAQINKIKERIDQEKKDLDRIRKGNWWDRGIKDIKNPSEAVQLAAIKQDVYATAIKDIKNPSEAVQLASVKNHWSNIQYIENPTEAVQIAAAEGREEERKIKDPFKKRDGDKLESLRKWLRSRQKVTKKFLGEKSPVKAVSPKKLSPKKSPVRKSPVKAVSPKKLSPKKSPVRKSPVKAVSPKKLSAQRIAEQNVRLAKEGADISKRIAREEAEMEREVAAYNKKTAELYAKWAREDAIRAKRKADEQKEEAAYQRRKAEEEAAYKRRNERWSKMTAEEFFDEVLR